ncbi:hypothetical protein PTSG_06417 [Salpingoeca rosetta]|uniref:Transcriptional coactivator p15 (PC4) C-terminal domain-containing protein n=1 Tax=Salpingoeca rosetta (strain ATCC 50818 / BSB-021) TaxID=946362 RepID=F2UBZ1_SALR5|nr:uncharacterized protein PTSG_06417 [Salpingoeca rosetta]EGD74406.1 hypothetical protein PTSG_06417 [Salpingoeca rosetta]|eukprot:XP_004993306.1 hypothetical protein PTSG_06417 [Salpingoeca rosetta]
MSDDKNQALVEENKQLRQCLRDVLDEVPEAKRAKIEALLGASSSSASSANTSSTEKKKTKDNKKKTKQKHSEIISSSSSSSNSSSSNASAQASPKKPDQESIQPTKDAEGGLHFSLDAKRRVSVTVFKGNVLVGLREWYEKDGKTLPGKGVSLKAPEWKSLVKNAKTATEAFEKQNFDFVTELGKTWKGQKRLSLRSYKGKSFFDVREHYEDKAGEIKPTRKGATLSDAVWKRLCTLMPHVDKAVAQLSGNTDDDDSDGDN